jgi:hypothetical protein
MRGGKSLLVILAVAAGIGAYVYFVEMKRDISDPSLKKEKIFPEVTSGKVEEIEVHAENGDVTTLKKTGDTWQIVAPATLEVDGPAVSAVASTLETIEAQKILDENPESVKDYGLDPPRYYLVFRAAGETAPRRLNVGSKTSIGADMYARAEGQTRLVLISSFLEDMLNRTTFNLREKTLLKFDTAKVDSLRLEVAGAPALAFLKKGSDWRLTAPIDAKADFGSVEGMVGRVSQTSMNAIVVDPAMPGAPAQPTPADLKKFGLDRPQLSITFGTGSSRATLVIGGKKDDTTLYARDLSRPIVFAVETKLLDDLKRKVDDVRVKDVFELRSFTVLGLDITRGGQTYSFAKERPAAENQSTAVEVWKQTKPAAKDVDQTKFTDFLTTLTNLRAEKFADKPLSGADELVVVGRSGDAASPKEERVTFRRSGATVQAIRPGDPGAAVVVTADFDKALNLFKELAGIK